MTFADLWALNLLWLLPLVFLGLTIGNRLKRRTVESYADSELLDRLMGKARKGKNFLKALLLLSSITLIVFALTGPRWGSHYQEVSQKGVDIMILVDVSPASGIDLGHKTARHPQKLLPHLHEKTAPHIGTAYTDPSIYWEENHIFCKRIKFSINS